MIARMPASPAPRRVLVLKPSSLGDVVTALPVLRGLRRTFPRAHLAWLVSRSCAPLIAADGDLDEVVLFDRHRLARAWRSPGALRDLKQFLRRLRQGEFDWAVDLQGLLRSGLFAAATRAPVRAGFADAREGAAIFYTHRVAVGEPHTIDRNIALARALGVEATPADLVLRVPPEGRDFAERLRRERLGGGAFLVCAPSTRWPTKRYPVRHWRTVIAKLSRELPVVLTGTAPERPLCERLASGSGAGVYNLAGSTDVRQLVGVIAAAAGVVCSDSAAKFIAAAVGTDSVTLIGPTRAGRTGPYKLGRAVVTPAACRGCLRRACRHGTCMEMISPADVIAAAAAMLSERSRLCR